MVAQQKICLVGLGLIGSSLGRAMIYKKLAAEVIGLEKDESLVARAMAVTCVDRATTNAADAVAMADMVILAVPMLAYGPLLDRLVPLMKKNAILSDVGSVKQTALDAMLAAIKKHDRADIKPIPAHPIAGTEFSGPESGKAHLFQDMYCLLTPPTNHDKNALAAVHDLWTQVGAKVEVLECQHHDEVLAMTSHLPHLIAYSIVTTAKNFEKDQAQKNDNDLTQREVIKYAASGWRDFTRIAASDPTMWRDIFLQNKTAVLEQIGRFQQDLDALTHAIEQRDGDFLYRWFDQTRGIRQALITQQPSEEQQQQQFYASS